MKHTKRLLLTVLALVILAQGCRPMAYFATRAIITAAVVAGVLATHDAHYHDHHCGHDYVYLDQREVYHYEDRWEYYDPHDGHWYHYENPPPELRHR